MDHEYKVGQGTPLPLGATADGNGTNFALFSEHGTAVHLCLFDTSGERQIARIALPEHTDGIWHGYVEGVGPGTVYGYRVDGPYRPLDGHRFNANKLLLDPYAKAHVGQLVWGSEIFGYVFETRDDTTFDTRDSAPCMPKCLVTEFETSAGGTQPFQTRVPWSDTILYELHVKGYTRLHPEVPEHLRGTYAGLGQPAVVEYIKSLGMTSIELLPVHTFLDESHLRDLQLTNYWGYNSIGFFTADPRYAAQPEQAFAEFQAMVECYHEAGLEVILDVVYNHTAEGGELGPTLSFRGIDNQSYYHLQAGNARYYVNDTGTGNTVDASHPRVVQMICDSLRYWVQQGGVDGFRFDLAPVLARQAEGFDPRSTFFQAIDTDPLLSRVKLIAEPWDIGPGGYQLGHFPQGWAEWNDTFRDRSRSFWTGSGNPLDLSRALAGSPEAFYASERRPWASVNFVTAHDGFTLHDLVSYNDKHNLANGEDNRDGSNGNRSWNCGVEGVTGDPAVLKLRDRQLRNLLGTLLLSQGVPMLVAGDEFGRTQNGNNNAYCQDNEISWVDWTMCKKNDALVQYTRVLTELRRQFPVLCSATYLDAPGSAHELTWLLPEGAVAERTNWSTQQPQCFGMLLCRSVGEMTSLAAPAAALLLLLNASDSDAPFQLPDLPSDRVWKLLIDTTASETASRVAVETYDLPALTLLLFAETTG
ncbi:MAG: glycogen debranching protein GlgX [Janthinobacterium lividum]